MQSFLQVNNGDCSDRTGAQGDLSHRWAHTSDGTFSDVAVLTKYNIVRLEQYIYNA